MSYCTTQDLISRFGTDELLQLTDRTNSGMIDEQVTSAAITDASNMIDGYLGGRYALPLSVVPSVLTKYCADIARFNLYDHQVPTAVENNNSAAMAYLKAVGKGELRLGISSESNESPTSDEAIQMTSSGSVFNRNDAKGFI